VIVVSIQANFYYRLPLSWEAVVGELSQHTHTPISPPFLLVDFYMLFRVASFIRMACPRFTRFLIER